MVTTDWPDATPRQALDTEVRSCVLEEFSLTFSVSTDAVE
jgi:hypothetical protein